jgi:hypothetical protein
MYSYMRLSLLPESTKPHRPTIDSSIPRMLAATSAATVNVDPEEAVAAGRNSCHRG